ncbi:MAG TPA: S-layer homology domain-containing protein [Acidimicrobiia bacterium]|nr:S-layer homology domain-containing protein [Acidimicrobiia bacterium]
MNLSLQSRRLRALAATVLVASIVLTGTMPASADHLLLIDADDLEAVEGGAPAVFSVALAAEPVEAAVVVVTLAVTSDNAEEVEITPTTLTFDSESPWNEAQQVTVSAVDDEVDDGDQVVAIALTVDDVLHGSVSVTTIDDDTAGVTVTQPDDPIVTTEAGGQQILTIRLDSQPTDIVRIGVASSDETEAVVDLDVLTFDSKDWSDPQEVTVTGVDDWTVDGDVAFTIVFSAAESDDATYAALAPIEVQGVNLDDDVLPPAPPAPADPEDEASTFDDFAGLSTEARQAIEALVDLGITAGTSDSTFSPKAVVTRWQMALFLTRQLVVHGVTLPAAAAGGFLDVSALDPDTREAITQLAQLQVTTGTDDETFDPDSPVTRWQMALFMSRVLQAAGSEVPAAGGEVFGDLGSLPSDVQQVIRQLAAMGVVEGVGDDRFDPDGQVTRWQMALFIVRTLHAAGDLG